MRPFAVVEALLIASLAVALIAKPKPRVVSAAPLINTPSIKTIVGDVKKLGDGAVHSWVRTTDSRPSALGITFTESALRGLTPGAARSATLALPRSVSPFTQISIAYNPDTDTFAVDFQTTGDQRIELPQTGDVPAATLTRAFLQTRPDVVRSIAQPNVYPAGCFPSSYIVKYDSSTREYTVALEGLVKH